MKTTDAEVKRIRDRYEAYYSNHGILSRWDPRNPGNQAIVRERRHALKDILHECGFFPLEGRTILDVGCGTGTELLPFLEWGADPSDACGIDLLPDRLAIAKEAQPRVTFRVENAERTTFDDASFDLVLMFTVMSSILDERMAVNVSRELTRVLKPGGAIVWYDFRWPSPYNRATRPVGQRALQKYFPCFQAHLRPVTLLPPVARRLGTLTGLLYPFLSLMPAMRSHLVGLLIKPRGGRT